MDLRMVLVRETKISPHACGVNQPAPYVPSISLCPTEFLHSCSLRSLQLLWQSVVLPLLCGYFELPGVTGYDDDMLKDLIQITKTDLSPRHKKFLNLPNYG